MELAAEWERPWNGAPVINVTHNEIPHHKQAGSRFNGAHLVQDPAKARTSWYFCEQTSRKRDFTFLILLDKFILRKEPSRWFWTQSCKHISYRLLKIIPPKSSLTSQICESVRHCSSALYRKGKRSASSLLFCYTFMFGKVWKELISGG